MITKYEIILILGNKKIVYAVSDAQCTMNCFCSIKKFFSFPKILFFKTLGKIFTRICFVLWFFFHFFAFYKPCFTTVVNNSCPGGPQKLFRLSRHSNWPVLLEKFIWPPPPNFSQFFSEKFSKFFSMKLTVKNFRIFFTMKSAVKNFSIA